MNSDVSTQTGADEGERSTEHLNAAAETDATGPCAQSASVIRSSWVLSWEGLVRTARFTLRVDACACRTAFRLTM
jgi:hypothetical protein